MIVADFRYNAFQRFIDNVDIADIAAWCEGSYDFNDFDHWWVSPNLLVNGELISDLVIPEGVKKIQEHAFAGFKNLTSVTLPESIEEIGYGAFISDNIEIFNFPAKTDYKIMGASFNAQAWLDTQPDVIYINNKLYHVKKTVKDLVIEDGTDEILMYCMNKTTMHNDDHNVESITIPASVNVIQNCAFIELPNLNKVVFEGPYTNFYSNETGQMAYSAFEMCYNLKDIYYNGAYNENLYRMFPGAENLDFYVPNIYVEDFRNNWDTSSIQFYPMNRNHTLTISDSQMATLWLDYDTTIPKGAEVFYGEEFDGSMVKMKKIEDGLLPRQTGVVVKGEKGTYSFLESDTEGTDVSSLLVGRTTAGTLNEPNFKYYKLSYNKEGNTLGFYFDNLDGSSIACKPYKAYLRLPNSNPSGVPTRGIGIDWEGTTELESVFNKEERNEVRYNLQGVCVNDDYNGLVIKNGKKMIVK